MKRPGLTILISCCISALAQAGPTTDKEVLQSAPPPCQWFRAHEWNLNLWGTYAFAANDTSTRHFGNINEVGDLAPESLVGYFDLGPLREDRFMDKDHAWGGGADVKFFFGKYWALGAEGFIVNSRNAGGAGLGTFTFRYPISCSRFAPYAFAGVGVLAGGSHSTFFYFQDESRSGRVEFTENRHIQNKHALAIGEFGAGLEIRITPRMGVMGDFAWNVVEEGHNDFGMVRSGVTLSY
jgi:hypothetical protein